MKLVSWNVNGIRACVRKGFTDYFQKIDADIFCIQETKCQSGQIDLPFIGYQQYWNYAEKKGYSGTAVFTKKKPCAVFYNIENKETEPEGRIIVLEYETFYLVNAYTPNAKRELTRLPERLVWEDNMRRYLIHLDQQKPVIYCGDLNVAHLDIDVKNCKANMGNSGFTFEERNKMTELLASGFVDSFRYLYPDRPDCFSWFSYMPTVRERNIGWRIDYFIVSEKIKNKIQEAEIHSQILGSDHCPVGLDIDLPM